MNIVYNSLNEHDNEFNNTKELDGDMSFMLTIFSSEMLKKQYHVLLYYVTTLPNVNWINASLCQIVGTKGQGKEKNFEKPKNTRTIIYLLSTVLHFKNFLLILSYY